ncbi:adenosine tri phosphatase, partial [Perkinsus sp. BL_2016]
MDLKVVSNIIKSNEANSEPNEDLYLKYKQLQRQVELVDLQESYIRDEYMNLQRELLRAKEEVKRIQSVPLLIGQFLELIDDKTAIVSSTAGSNHIVRIMSTVDKEHLKPSSTVALHRHSQALVQVLPPEADSSIAVLGEMERPDVT